MINFNLDPLSVKIKLFIYLILLSALFGFLPNSYGSQKDRIFNSVSGPDLIYPMTDHIVLAGKDFLEFRWEKADIIKSDHFEFRLYRGYKITASALIFKQNFPRDIYPIKIPIDLLENNQVYTWSLRQVFMNGEKSDRSFSSFKVIKK